MNDYRILIVWQKAMDLVEAAYRLIRLLPREEQLCLASQMRRAAVSIPSNIAEGNGRSSTREYIRFLNIARGSKQELETQLYLCIRLGYLQPEQIDSVMADAESVGKMLSALIRKLQTLTPFS